MDPSISRIGLAYTSFSSTSPRYGAYPRVAPFIAFHFHPRRLAASELAFADSMAYKLGVSDDLRVTVTYPSTELSAKLQDSDCPRPELT